MTMAIPRNSHSIEAILKRLKGGVMQGAPAGGALCAVPARGMLQSDYERHRVYVEKMQALVAEAARDGVYLELHSPNRGEVFHHDMGPKWAVMTQPANNVLCRRRRWVDQFIVSMSIATKIK